MDLISGVQPSPHFSTPSPPTPGRIQQASSSRLGARLRVRCTRGICARGSGYDGIRPPGSQQQAWQRSAVAVDGVEVGKEAAEAAEDDGWGEQQGDDSVSYARMLKFILPTLGIWLASPIMSLVDAGVVGEFGSDDMTDRYIQSR